MRDYSTRTICDICKETYIGDYVTAKVEVAIQFPRKYTFQSNEKIYQSLDVCEKCLEELEIKMLSNIKDEHDYDIEEFRLRNGLRYHPKDFLKKLFAKITFKNEV